MKPVLAANLLGLFVAVWSHLGYSQTWPTRPIRFVIPFAPGGPSDIVARAMAVKLQPALGQPVLIDNLLGAGGAIGIARVAKSTPDGYTIGYAANSTQAIIPHMYRSLDYDPVKDFTYITKLAEYVNVLVVSSSSPYRTVSDIVKAAKAGTPGALTYASAGSGSTIHLSGELLATMTGVKFTHVPYKGSGPAILDVVAGRVSFMFDLLVNSRPQISADKLRAIATTGRSRMHQLPDLPTVAETVPGFTVENWVAVLGPAGMPKPITERLNLEFRKALQMQEVTDKFSVGYDISPSTPDQLAELVRRDLEYWGPIVRASGATVD